MTAEKIVEIFIAAQGQLSFIHDEDIAEALQPLGQRYDRRASLVEPDPDHPGQWLADMSPTCGFACLLGPFATRREALQAERTWLNDWYSGREISRSSNSPPGAQ